MYCRYEANTNTPSMFQRDSLCIEPYFPLQKFHFLLSPFFHYESRIISHSKQCDEAITKLRWIAVILSLRCLARVIIEKRDMNG